MWLEIAMLIEKLWLLIRIAIQKIDLINSSQLIKLSFNKRSRALFEIKEKKSRR